MDIFEFDQEFRKQGYNNIAGIDEAGRGPLAGPVVASCVIMSPDVYIEGLCDSKKITPSKRERLYNEIQKNALAIGIGIVSHEIIDKINILQATFLAMKEALSQISCQIDIVLVDGWPIPDLLVPQKAIVNGDGKSASIAAASIISKVTRDRIMLDLSFKYPEYHFESNKGYGTSKHLEALNNFGPSPIHRTSFAPVRDILNKKVYIENKDDK